MFGFFGKNIDKQMFGYYNNITNRTDVLFTDTEGVSEMKKLLIILMMAAAFTFGFFGQNLLSAQAQEEDIPELNRYFTSIQIQDGDSLWDIAGRYSEGSGYSRREYVEELKRMNGLRHDRIHSGEYLTVVYFAE